METIRSFISFDIDDEQVLRNLSKVQRALLETGADLKIVEPENIHVTVKFLGDIQPSIVDRIHEEMKKIAFTPFNIKIKGLGAFPNLRRMMVAWAGIEEGAEELKDVYNQLESNFRVLGFKPEPRGFSPHLTIARVRTGRSKNELAKVIEQMAGYEFGVIKAKCLRLKKSVLTPKGPIYTLLKEVCH
mgnify:CR=1 FL=1